MGINSYASWERLENCELFSIASVLTELLGRINSTELVTNSGDALSSKFFLPAHFIWWSSIQLLAIRTYLYHMTSDRAMAYVVKYTIYIYIYI